LDSIIFTQPASQPVSCPHCDLSTVAGSSLAAYDEQPQNALTHTQRSWRNVNPVQSLHFAHFVWPLCADQTIRHMQPNTPVHCFIFFPNNFSSLSISLSLELNHRTFRFANGEQSVAQLQSKEQNLGQLAFPKGLSLAS